MTAPPRAVIPSRWPGRRYLFRIGRFAAPSYAAMLYAGCVLGGTAGARIAHRSGIEPLRFALAAALLLIPALVGGRLWYVLQHPERFAGDPARVWRTQEGGAGLYGGLLLSFAVSRPVLAAVQRAFWTFWDAAAVMMLAGMTVTRFGCLINGCCAGRETDGPLGVYLPDQADQAGRWLRRYPVQLPEAGWSALILAGELAARPHLPAPGALFLSAAAVAALAARWRS